MISISNLWKSQSPDNWNSALKNYWNYVNPKNIALEQELNDLQINQIINFSQIEWYNFLHDRYFRWKYTAPNRYVTTTRSLKKYKELNQLDILFDIKKRLMNFDTSDISKGLSIAKEIKGLGFSGASGLLSLIYPNHFGTIDQFAVKALCQIPELPEIKEIEKMNPENLTLINGILLINIMIKKAKENNNIFGGDFWTPRKIDMILWASRQKNE